MTRGKLQGGYLRIENHNDRDKAFEADTYTCKHCNRIVIVKPMCDPADLGRRCGGCDGLLCKRCSALDGCSHIEKRLAVMESRAAALASILGG